jgi:hypothetical protein
MAFYTDEILEHLAEETEISLISDEARVYAHDHLEESDDDYVFVEEGMERCADRGYRDPAWDHLKRPYQPFDEHHPDFFR